MSSDAVLSSATNSALGTVIMATEYDSLNPGFLNKQIMENHDMANSSKPSVSFLHPVECKRSVTSVNVQYVRTGPVPANGDIRLYDLGVFQLATQGQQANGGVIGELWVSYEVELFKPQIDNIGNYLSDHYVCNSVTSLLPIGSVKVKQAGSSINTVITNHISDGQIITFPATLDEGNYLVTYSATVMAACGTMGTITVDNISGLTLLPYFKNETLDTIQAPVIGFALPGNAYGFSFLVKLNDASATLRITNVGGATTTVTAYADLWITSVDADILTKQHEPEPEHKSRHQLDIDDPSDSKALLKLFLESELSKLDKEEAAPSKAGYFF